MLEDGCHGLKLMEEGFGVYTNIIKKMYLTALRVTYYVCQKVRKFEKNNLLINKFFKRSHYHITDTNMYREIFTEIC